MKDKLVKQVMNANKELFRRGLVEITWGNVSGIDRKRGIVVIKPSGVPYTELTPDKMVTVDLDGKLTRGNKLKPSTDIETHIVLYKTFEKIGGIVHTHSKWATSWAQAEKGIEVLGTTHADYFFGTIPCTRRMTKKEVENNYEYNTGIVIVETMRQKRFSSAAMKAVLVNKHGPFTWGADPNEAVENAVTLEIVARMAYNSTVLSPGLEPMRKYLLDKHFFRKHGENAYYGQK